MLAVSRVSFEAKSGYLAFVFNQLCYNLATMSKENKVGQSISGAEGTAQTPVEELEQSILQYLGDENSPQMKAFSHIARRYEIDAEAAKTGRNQTQNRVTNQREINEGLSDPEYRREWSNINRKLPTWRNVITQGITDAYVQSITFAQKLVDIKNAAEARSSQQPPPQAQK